MFRHVEDETCAFSNEDCYMCTINGLLVTNDNENCEEIEFLHQERKTNLDVERNCATDSIMNFLPIELLGKFRNLKHLKFSNVKLQQLSENSLENCAQLETMDLRGNKILKLLKKLSEIASV